MELVIKNFKIDAPIMDIILLLKKDCKKPLFKTIQDKGDYIRTNCPSHKGGMESHPSFSIYNRKDNPDITYGTCHCFTCGYSASLPRMIGECFDMDTSYGENWLIKHFSDGEITEVVNELEVPKFDFNWDFDNYTKEKEEYLDPSILEEYNYYHPYMKQRKLTTEVIDKFQVGYDKGLQAITFPVYDENHNLVMVTKREILTKRFHIPAGVNKPVYLLYDILDRNVKKVFICESQINALTLRGWGYDSVALFGTGSSYQYNILNNAGIYTYVLCFDGDLAGHEGAKKFKKNIKNSFIYTVNMPQGKDVNDLNKEEFDKLLEKAYTN